MSIISSTNLVYLHYLAFFHFRGTSTSGITNAGINKLWTDKNYNRDTRSPSQKELLDSRKILFLLLCKNTPDIRDINEGNVIYLCELNKYYFSSFTDGKLKVEIKTLKLASYFIKCLITSCEQSHSGEQILHF